MQSLRISSHGDASVVPKNRTLDIHFKNIKTGTITVMKNGEKLAVKKKYGDHARVEIDFQPFAEYEITVEMPDVSAQEQRADRAFEILLRAEGINAIKNDLYLKLKKVNTVEEYVQAVDSETRLSAGVRGRLKENL